MQPLASVTILMRIPRIWLAAAVVLSLASCSSVERMAVNRLGDVVASTGTTFSGDDDPELVGQALPFSLKLMESILADTPRHRGLLTAAAKGFTQYSYGWVADEAERLEEIDLDRAIAQRVRARRLYLRARDYGLRALETSNARFRPLLTTDSAAAVALAKKDDVPALYWTAAAWGLAIGLSKDDPDLIADLPLVQAMIYRAAELDPTYGDGAIETFLISYEATDPSVTSTRDALRARMERSVALSSGQLATPYVAFAEDVSVRAKDRAEFETLLNKALAIDPNARPEWRIENLLAQRRAARLLERRDDLFFDETTAARSEQETKK